MVQSCQAILLAALRSASVAERVFSLSAASGAVCRVAARLDGSGTFWHLADHVSAESGNPTISLVRIYNTSGDPDSCQM
ncbi:hypothetical protein Pr1d_12300 [Bythopirellula goksoeyrii]|uniref:Uncharacterized protein n=1 Tax=Bythopirellula goksoeyrii TaxID=1400387 RepID=A0A5B9Q8G9_9BACT|nr:hypothetical protein Pr1d_12300 [Bythopirellula goksoeyrii]